MNLIFATRPSPLARWQTQHVIQLLASHWPDLTCLERVITTRGDLTLDEPLPSIGGKGLFTSELERALLQGEADAAVHSLKDLPTENIPGLLVPVIPQRADPRDVWICPAGLGPDELPAGSVVGTSSLRRQAQLLARRPDLQVRSIRGNVDTRLRKVMQGQYDAIILAAAGVMRLGLEHHITQTLPLEWMLPAPGQGALAIQCREQDEVVIELLRAIHHTPTSAAVRAERAFLSALGGGCSVPVGALANLTPDSLELRAAVLRPDGRQAVQLSGTGHEPEALGQKLARQALSQGAASLLAWAQDA